MFIIFFQNLSAEENLIVYINMDRIMNETIAGKSINNQIQKIHNANLEDFKKIEKSIKNEETEIVSQKNTLSNEDYQKKINSLRAKINNYKKSRQERINALNKKRINASSVLLKKINPILSDYSNENGISIILPKKNVILAKTNLDITNTIIDLANLKIKEIELK